MDKGFEVRFFHSLYGVSRQTSLTPRVGAIGHLCKKRKRESGKFDTSCAFTFILDGAGEYRRFRGPMDDSGPPPPGTTWDHGPPDPKSRGYIFFLSRTFTVQVTITSYWADHVE